MKIVGIKNASPIMSYYRGEAEVGVLTMRARILEYPERSFPSAKTNFLVYAYSLGNPCSTRRATRLASYISAGRRGRRDERVDYRGRDIHPLGTSFLQGEPV